MLFNQNMDVVAVPECLVIATLYIIMTEEIKLKLEHAQFVQEYLVDFNGTQAYMRVYPDSSEEAAASSGSVLLRNPKIKKAIEQGAEDKIARTKITQDKVLAEYAKIAFFDIRQLYDDRGELIPVYELPEDVARALSGIEHFVEYETIGNHKELTGRTTKVKTNDKNKALDSMGKHLGMFPSKHEIGGPGGGPIAVTKIVEEIIDPEET